MNALRSCACLVALVALAAFGAPRAAHAATYYDPALSYHTVENLRFAVHYPPGARNMAIRVLRRAHALLVADAALLGNMPAGKIDIVLTDTQDDANGSAQVLPKNILRLYLAAPTELNGLADYDDWLDLLLTHELSHLVDLDHTRGFTRFLRNLFGRVVAYNGSTPQFLSEGVAVYAETKLGTRGRGRASYVETLIRNAALNNTFPTIDQAHILFARFPYGNVAYYFGGRFHLYLSERFGEDAVARLHSYYASQLIPLFYAPGAISILGQSLPALWQDFARAEQLYGAEVAARIKTSGETVTWPLTHEPGDLNGARFSPTGDRVVYSRRSPFDGPTLRLVTLPDQREQRLALDTFNRRLTFDLGGQGFFYSQQAITHRFDNFGELYFYDLGRHRRRRLRDAAAPHASLRIKDPALHPDGETLYFVTTEMQQSWLRVGTVCRDRRGHPVSLTHVRDLVPPSGDRQVASPALSPDGKLLALSMWHPGGLRDLHLLDAHTGEPLRRITQDVALDGNPTFSPDGALLLYESDADGISNIYAYRLSDGRYAQVTQVLAGAYQPELSPDGKTLLMRVGTPEGFDLHHMPFVPDNLVFAHYDPDQGYGRAAPAADTAWAHAPLEAPLPRSDEPRLQLEAGRNETEGRYRPWRTFLPHRDNWLLIPSVYFINNSFGVALQTGGQDVLGTHTWAGQVGMVQRGGGMPSASLLYVNDQLLPSLSLGLEQSVTPYAFAEGYAVQTDTGLSAGMAWPWARRHVLDLSYGLTHRRGDALARALLPLDRNGSLSLGYRYRFTRQFTYSISPEHGRSLSLNAQWFSRGLGGSQDAVVLTGAARAYFNNPLWPNHVLALGLNGSYAFGPDRVKSFFLYGSQGASLLTVQSSTLLHLRGFLPSQGPYGAPRAGSGVMAGYGEYRFPVWHVQCGVGTLPIFFEHVHVALFTDVGNTLGDLTVGAGRTVHRNAGWAWRHLWLGSGAEARLDVTLAWATTLTLRMGLAQGILASGRQVIAQQTPMVYFDVGTTL